MWTVVIGSGVAGAVAAGFRAWSTIESQRSRERSVARLALARESGADFDLPAAIEQLHAQRQSG
jgi:hypothetical protein